MRAVILAIVHGVALAAPSVQAAPVPTKATPVEPASAPPVEPAPKGCGCGLASRPGGGAGWQLLARLTESENVPIVVNGPRTEAGEKALTQ